jgi:uncharacterized membrane protein YjdF
MKAILIKQSLFLIIIIFILNKVANLFFWYTSIVWFDMMMHFLGGVFVALALGSVLTGYLKNAENKKVFWVILVSVLVVGLGWEVFEFSVQELVKVVGLADIPDSLSDLLFDALGAIVGTFFVIRAKNKYTCLHNG